MVSLVQKLSAKPASNARLSPGRISLDYDGKRLSFKAVKRTTVFVGNWSRSKNEVYYDAHLTDPVEIKSICIHEAVEKYVAQKYGLDVDKQAHRVAQAVEKSWFEKHERSWAYYNRKVTKIWRMHGSR